MGGWVGGWGFHDEGRCGAGDGMCGAFLASWAVCAMTLRVMNRFV